MQIRCRASEFRRSKSGCDLSDLNLPKSACHADLSRHSFSVGRSLGVGGSSDLSRFVFYFLLHTSYFLLFPIARHVPLRYPANDAPSHSVLPQFRVRCVRTPHVMADPATPSLLPLIVGGALALS